MSKVLFLTVIISLLSSCATKLSQRSPSSISNTKFAKLFDDIELAVDKGTTSTLECSIQLDSFYLDLFDIDSKSIEMEKFTSLQLTDFAKTSFLVRLEIKEKMKALKLKTEDDYLCLKSIKNIVRALRYVEDYLIEFAYTNDQKINEEFNTLSGVGAHFQVAPAFKDEFLGASDLRSGDVILSRGNAYSSAAIARIGDDDSQFSHLSLVYKNQYNEIYTSEAHIEVGNVVAPISAHIEQNNARTVIFRHTDSKLAHHAGKYMHDKIKAYKRDHGTNIKYDFAMIYQDDEEIFCSEVIYHGFKVAGRELYNQDVDLPMYKTKFKPGLIPFLKGIGIPVNSKNIKTFKTFGPGEIQFDPRFDIVAEWRNPSKLKDSRFKDAILSKIFTWMEYEKYKFIPTLGNRASHSFAWLMRKTKWTRAVIEKLTGQDLEKKFPLNMGVKQLNLFVVLDKVGETLYLELQRHQDLSNSPLSFKELFIILEDYKNRDFEVYKKYKADRRYNIKTNSSGKRRKRRKIKRPSFHLNFRN